MPEIKMDVNFDLKPSDITIARALTILDWYLADHPEKTIVVKQELNLRVCLIADEVKGQEAELPGPWISVKERLPGKHGTYLCWCENLLSPAIISVIFRADKNAFWSYEMDKAIDGITHWMPMIEGPKEEANGEEKQGI